MSVKSKCIFVDTNAFLRFFLKDNEEQYNQIFNLLEKASEGKFQIVTSSLVFFEIKWVLSSFYELSKNQVTEKLKALLSLDYISMDDSIIFQEALELWENNSLSLEDCYHNSYAKQMNCDDFFTFDKKLKKAFQNK